MGVSSSRNVVVSPLGDTPVARGDPFGEISGPRGDPFGAITVSPDPSGTIIGISPVGIAVGDIEIGASPDPSGIRIGVSPDG